jgi:hypothetical protein
LNICQELKEDRRNPGEVAMNDDLSRKLREADSRMKHQANNELCDMRWWYYGLPTDRRAQFKQQLQALAELSEQFALDWNMSVKVRFSWTQYDHEGELLMDLGGNQPPQEILAAIAQWDEAEEFFNAPSAE